MLSLVISANELNKSLQGKNSLLILDLSDIDTYMRATVPGARHFPYVNLISGEPPYNEKLPKAEKFSAALASVGYKEGDRIVAFDDEFGLKAARLYWTMCMAELDGFSYLNGGLNAWLEEGCSSEEGIDGTKIRASLPLPLKWSGDYLATKEEINSSLKKMFLWDTRSYKEWVGENESGTASNTRSGRIPGSHQLDWISFLDEKGRIISKAKAKKLLEDFLGGNKLPIVAYCRTHRRSAIAFLIADYLGVQIKGYDGSWMEWGAIHSLPLETGDD